MWNFHGSQFGLEFFAGWLTEYSLSVDNLFIFIIIMASFNVPKIYQQQALLVGIVLALIFRGIFIALGAVAIKQFSWIFYVFGAFLVYTAIKLVRDTDHSDDAENAVVRFARTYLNTTDKWDGLKLYIKEDGKRLMTPMFLVIVALGTTDLLFALDSIPAIYGLTSEPYLVFTANVFALMGLRQLYFLLGDLLKRLVYLSQGLAFILFFIGVKLVLHALHENDRAVHQRRRARQRPGDSDAAEPGRHHPDVVPDDGGQPGEDPGDRQGLSLPVPVITTIGAARPRPYRDGHAGDTDARSRRRRSCGATSPSAAAPGYECLKTARGSQARSQDMIGTRTLRWIVAGSAAARRPRR